jgi:hypothetical protein
MRSSAVVVLTICFGLAGPVAFADDPSGHPLPETGSFDDPRVDVEYYSVLRKHFASRPHQWVQVVIQPSNQREEMVSIEGPDLASAQLVHVKAKRSIWEAYLNAVGPNGADGKKDVHSLTLNISVPVDRHVVALDASVQARIIRAWVAFLRMTQYGPFTDRADDGTTYHFTAFVPHYGVIAGKTWSPSSGSLSGQFVAMAGLLGDYADSAPTARPSVQAKIEKTLRQIESLVGLATP